MTDAEIIRAAISVIDRRAQVTSPTMFGIAKEVLAGFANWLDAQETVTDDRPDFVTEWKCEPPGFGDAFRVVREEWVTSPAGKPVRRVYQWVPA